MSLGENWNDSSEDARIRTWWTKQLEVEIPDSNIREMGNQTLHIGIAVPKRLWKPYSETITKKKNDLGNFQKCMDVAFFFTLRALAKKYKELV